MDRRAGLRVSVRGEVELPVRYELIRRIARGGMATVWCAHDRTLERKVAVKVLADPYAHDEMAVRRFMREARTAARLSGHRHVVTIYDVGRDSPSDQAPLGRPFIVMEYLAGGTLADAARVGELNRALALRWIAEAAGALDYAHARGVVHRDVKPSNLLLDGERVLHVADFGIAHLSTEDTLTGTGQMLGTAAYLAPERALGRPATDASDRYALAVVAYELLVGERPFAAEHFAALARAHIEDLAPPASTRNPDLPSALDGVLARGLAKRPQERFETARDLAAAIVEAASTLPRRRAAGGTPRTRAVVGGGPTARRAITGSGRRRAPAVTALALAALALALIVAIGQQGASPARARHAAARTGAHRGGSHSSASAASRAAATTTATAPSTGTAAASPTSADQLESRGHDLMMAGKYAGAIPVLREAVATAPTDSLTYAYALYDLGRSLRLAGDPQAAVPILTRRLEIPNQTGAVRTELLLALRAAGQSAGGGGNGGNGNGGGGD